MRNLASLIIIFSAFLKLANAAFGPRYKTRKRVIVEGGREREQVIRQEVYSRFQQWAARLFLAALVAGVGYLWWEALHPAFPEISQFRFR